MGLTPCTSGGREPGAGAVNYSPRKQPEAQDPPPLGLIELSAPEPPACCGCPDPPSLAGRHTLYPGFFPEGLGCPLPALRETPVITSWPLSPSAWVWLFLCWHRCGERDAGSGPGMETDGHADTRIPGRLRAQPEHFFGGAGEGGGVTDASCWLYLLSEAPSPGARSKAFWEPSTTPTAADAPTPPAGGCPKPTGSSVCRKTGRC